MEPMAILSADPLDLLFENRNKSYGAYTLRKYYDQRLLKSIGTTMTAVTLISFIIYMNLKAHPYVPKMYVDTVCPIINVVLDPPAKKPMIPPSRPASVKPPATIQYTVPLIVAQIPPQPMASIEDLNANAIGEKTIAGPANPDAGQGQSTGGAPGTAAIETPVEPVDEVLKIADVMPEFPGGIEGLKRYLTRNLKMPENELEEGALIRVVARFVVGTDGKVTRIEITQPAGQPFNAEVLRVVSKMPAWKPGMQNHRAVAVYFSLPVNFVNQNE